MYNFYVKDLNYLNFFIYLIFVVQKENKM